MKKPVPECFTFGNRFQSDSVSVLDILPSLNHNVGAVILVIKRIRQQIRPRNAMVVAAIGKAKRELRRIRARSREGIAADALQRSRNLDGC